MYILIGLKHCVMSNNIWALCSDGLHTLVEYVLEKKGNCSVLRHNPSTSYPVYKKWRSTNRLLHFSTNLREYAGGM